MKHLWAISVGGLAVGMLFIFQNCGAAGRSVAGAMSSSSQQGGLSSSGGNSPSITVPGDTFNGGSVSGGSVGGTSSAEVISITGSTITIGDGQNLTLSNTTGAIGTVTLIGSQPSADGSGYEFQFRLYSPLSGRMATINVLTNLDQTKIVGVEPGGELPYMCHDPAADPCANYPNLSSGAMESNCNSPIHFSGVLTGSVGNVSDTAYTKYNCGGASAAQTPVTTTPTTVPAQGSTVATNVCHVAFDGGGSITTANQSLAACQAECRRNAHGNSDGITCTLDDQEISF